MFRFYCIYCKNVGDDLHIGVTDMTHLKKLNKIPLPTTPMEFSVNCEKCGHVERFRVLAK
jgi:hypothetical protein